MYAIVEIAGQQFKVAKEQKVFVHRLTTQEGKKVSFDNVFLIGDGNKVTIGAPAIDGAQVGAKVLKHLKGDKVIVFKKKRRKGYRVKNGHRQALSEIIIESIVASGAKPTSVKTTAGKKAEPAKAKKTTIKKEVKAKASVEKPKVEKAAPKKVATKKEAPTQDLSKMTVAELKVMAKEKGLKGYSSLKKADLIAALS